MLANCRECGTLFNKMVHEICPQCLRKEQERFEAVRRYLSKNKYASMVDVIRHTEVLMEEIAGWIEEGKLELKEFPNVNVECKGCGMPTRAGLYCESCRNDIIMELADATEHVRRLRQGPSHLNQIRFHTRDSHM